MKIRIFIVVSFLIFYFSDACLANPIIAFPSFGGTFTFNTGYALLIDCLSDFIVLFLAYLVIRKVRILICLKFLVYLVFVFIGGIIIDAVSSFFLAIIFMSLSSSSQGLDILIFFIFVGLLLYFYNSFLSKKFFNLENNQAKIIGTVMALLTNPVIGMLLSNGVNLRRH
jgi:hypothetical protein